MLKQMLLLAYYETVGIQPGEILIGNICICHRHYGIWSITSIEKVICMHI
jgi:hypothetical protein